jgi:hypothetical protein
LIDALVPATVGKYDEYVLDTKARGLPDSQPGKPDRLEAKLYVNYGDQPRITKTSSVDLYIGNHENIKMPADGIKLRYTFKSGSQMVYDLEQRVAEDTISESENAKGGKAAELPLDSETIRLLYAVDNSYTDGDGLVRIQALPDKGKNYAILTTTLNNTPTPYYDNQMSSIYMRLTSTGHEVFGSVPMYWAMEGTAGEGVTTDLFADYPLPTLPVNPVKPGSSWQSRFQEPHLDLTNIFASKTLVEHFPAVGEFVDTEWERGHPCAKIQNSIQASEMSEEDKKLIAQGAGFGGDKVQLQETIWFALDTHQVLKILRDMTVEVKQQTAGVGGGPPGMPGGGQMPGGGRPPMPGGAGSDKNNFPGSLSINQRLGRGPGRPGGGVSPGRPGAGIGPGGPMGGNSPYTNNGPAANEGQYVRLRIQQIFTLE